MHKIIEYKKKPYVYGIQAYEKYLHGNKVYKL